MAKDTQLERGRANMKQSISEAEILKIVNAEMKKEETCVGAVAARVLRIDEDGRFDVFYRTMMDPVGRPRPAVRAIVAKLNDICRLADGE
jgi:hypothetical protein